MYNEHMARRRFAALLTAAALLVSGNGSRRVEIVEGRGERMETVAFLRAPSLGAARLKT